MAPTSDNQVLIDALSVQLERQPWYKTFANTVTSGAGLVVLVLWTLVSAGLDIPDTAEKWVAALIAAFTTLGVMQTKNGLTSHGIQRVEKVAGDL